MDVRFGLIFDRPDDFFIAVTRIGHANASCEIDIFFAFHIRNDGSSGFRAKDGMGVEGSLGNVFVSFCKQGFVRLHGIPSLPFLESVLTILEVPHLVKPFFIIRVIPQLCVSWARGRAIHPERLRAESLWGPVIHHRPRPCQR